MLLAPEDEDIRRVAAELGALFADTVPPAVVTRIVWQACRELSVEVPRAALAEFTHRSARQRLWDISTNRRRAGATVTRTARRRTADSRAA